MSLRWLLVGCVLQCIQPSQAAAQMRRFGLFVGSNQGFASERRLQFAEADAERMGDTMGALGDMRAEDIVLLRGGTSEDVRRALKDLQIRLRVAKQAGQQTMLMVYYSGHGDAASLHMSATSLSIEELRIFTRDSPAHLRILIVDACRSGGVTGVKGATAAPEFIVHLEDHIPREGFAVITSSSASEESQESARWGGSIFTVAFATGLAGAADPVGRNMVSLHDAYAYAYERTLAATRQTVRGPQHPTFEYGLRGKGDLPLTRPGTRNERYGIVAIESPGDYYFEPQRGTGPAQEVAFASGIRQVQMPPGNYRLERRAHDHLLVGEIQIRPNEVTFVNEKPLRRVAYAQAIRKGGIAPQAAWEVGVGYTSLGRLSAATPPSFGPQLSVNAHLAMASLGLQWEATQVAHQGVLPGNFRSYSALTTLQLPMDVGSFNFWMGAEVGITMLRQSFAPSTRLTPKRVALTPALGLRAGVSRQVIGPLVLSIQGGLRAYLLREEVLGKGPLLQPGLVPSVAATASWQWLS